MVCGKAGKCAKDGRSSAVRRRRQTIRVSKRKMMKKKKLVQGRRRSKLVQGGEEFAGRGSRESMRIPGFLRLN
jgi:hypothetical protein